MAYKKVPSIKAEAIRKYGFEYYPEKEKDRWKIKK